MQLQSWWPKIENLKQIGVLQNDVDQSKQKWHQLSNPPNNADISDAFVIAETPQPHSVSPADDNETGQSGDSGNRDNPTWGVWEITDSG